MTTIDDGGPAFPTNAVTDGFGRLEKLPHPGMSLRVYFAGQALVGILSHPQWDGTRDGLAEGCLKCADALIARLRAETAWMEELLRTRSEQP